MDTPGQFVYKRGHNAITVNLSDVALILMLHSSDYSAAVEK